MPADGQRVAVQRDGPLGAVYPKYFGYYEQAITLYAPLLRPVRRRADPINDHDTH